MRPTKLLILPFDAIDDVAQVLDVPRGELLHIAMNPYNGNIVMNYQDNPNARLFIRLIVDQLATADDMFSAPSDEELSFAPSYGFAGVPA